MRRFTFLIAIMLLLLCTSIAAQTPLGAPTIKSASGVSTTGITTYWTAGLGTASSYTVTIYDATSSVVTTGSAIGSSTTLAITGLTLSKNTPYSYTVTAIGDGSTTSNSTESTKSIPFYIQTDNSVVFQYAATDVSILNNDLKSAINTTGAADIYELTTAGGAYTFSTGSTSNNNTLTKSTTIRAKSGLAQRPVLKLSSTTAGATCNIIYSTTAGLTVTLDGLEFDGVNTTGTGQPLAFYSTGANTKLYITNCYLHDFKNLPGNGVIRLDGASTDALIDIQGSTFNSCGGRILYHNPTASAYTRINLKNNTFCNSLLYTSRANIIYGAQVNSATTSIDHCTFYSITTTSGSEGMIRYPAGYGAITITNSIFFNVAQTLPTATISNCYLAGFTGTVPTGTNTLTTAPSFTNTATLDFSLTNRSSLVGNDGITAGNASYYPVATALSSPTTGAATLPTNVGFTANWTNSDPHASNFTIKTYIGGNLATTTTASSGSNSQIISGLISGLDYTYTVTAVGDGINYSASAESNPMSVTTSGRVASIATDFSELSWGTALLTLPANGSFGTTYTNGFILNSAVLYTGSSADSKGVNHTNRISLDKSTYLGSIILPTVSSISQIEIHGSMGTAGNGIAIKELNTTTNTWSAIGGTLVYDAFSKTAGTDSIYVISISRNTPTTLKIENASTGSGNIWQIITRTTSPALLATPSSLSATSITPTSFVANWNPVTNASNYEIRVYKKSVLKSTTITTNGQSSNSIQINSLEADSTYTFKIKALGDGGLTYLDSYLSATSTFTAAGLLTTPVVNEASNIGETSFTANWGAVANAVSYDVYLYDGSMVQIGSATNVANTFTSYEFTGLTKDVTYNYKVMAIGNNTTTFNSVLSEAKSVTPSTPTAIQSTQNNSGIVVNGSTLTAKDAGNFAIYSAQGKQVAGAMNTSSINTQLQKGIYIVRFTSTSGAVMLQKVIIK